MSKALKVISIVLCVLGFIGSVSTAKVLGEFSFTLFLSNFMAVAISSAVLYAVGQILDNQDDILQRLKKLQEASVQEPAPKMNTEPLGRIPSVSREFSGKSAKAGYWKCPRCGTENPIAANVCTHCKSGRN